MKTNSNEYRKQVIDLRVKSIILLVNEAEGGNAEISRIANDLTYIFDTYFTDRQAQVNANRDFTEYEHEHYLDMLTAYEGLTVSNDRRHLSINTDSFICLQYCNQMRFKTQLN